jgi:hypothetical protein
MTGEITGEIRGEMTDKLKSKTPINRDFIKD